MSPARKARIEPRRQWILAEIAEALGSVDDDTNDIQVVLGNTEISFNDIAGEFGDHHGLINALNDMFATSMLEPLAEQGAGITFRQRLLAFAERVAEEHTSLRWRNLDRISRSGVGRGSRSAREFCCYVPGLLTRGLARFLHEAQERGVRLRGDYQRLAMIFIALLRADLDATEVLPKGPVRRAGRELCDVSRTVNLFCFGIQTGNRDVQRAR